MLNDDLTIIDKYFYNLLAPSVLHMYRTILNQIESACPLLHITKVSHFFVKFHVLNRYSAKCI